MIVEFFVPGQPRTKGSPHIGRTKDGRAFMAPDSKKSSDWQKQVRHEAHYATQGRIPFGPKVAVKVRADFILPRANGHFGAKGIRPSAPQFPASRPDLDKMLRSILDGMIGVVFADDGQVIEIVARKHYAMMQEESAGVQIKVSAA